MWTTKLIIYQTAEMHAKIREMLEQIRDIRPIQISVETRFIFVTDNFLEDIGLDLDFYLNPTGRWTGPDTRPITAPPAGTGLPGFRSGIHAPLIGTQGSSSFVLPGDTGVPGSIGASATALTIAGSYLDKLEVDFFIRATQASRQATTLTAPKATFENGSSARIFVGRQNAYVEDIEPVTDQNVGLYDITIGRIESGPTLNIAGVVSPDRRFVRLDVEVNLSQLVDLPFLLDLIPEELVPMVGPLGLQQLPIIDTTEITTQVSVPDGGALLIGGLRQKSEETKESGVPILNKLPWLKRFFSNTSYVDDKAVLIILLRPRIVDLKEQQGVKFPSLGEH